MKLGMKFVVVIVNNHVFNPRGCLKTMALVATEVEGNYKISKIIDILCNFKYLSCLMKKQNKVESLLNN